jgi:hypothetical protein
MGEGSSGAGFGLFSIADMRLKVLQICYLQCH